MLNLNKEGAKMSILDNAVEKFGEAMGVVASTTEKAVKVGKKKYNIAALNNKLDKFYIELGKAYFDKNKESENLEPQCKEIINDIKDILTKIEIAKAELEEIKHEVK